MRTRVNGLVSERDDVYVNGSRAEALARDSSNGLLDIFANAKQVARTERRFDLGIVNSKLRKDTIAAVFNIPDKRS